MENISTMLQRTRQVSTGKGRMDQRLKFCLSTDLVSHRMILDELTTELDIGSSIVSRKALCVHICCVSLEMRIQRDKTWIEMMLQSDSIEYNLGLFLEVRPEHYVLMVMKSLTLGLIILLHLSSS